MPNIAIRLNAEGGAAIKRELEEVGRSGKQAFDGVGVAADSAAAAADRLAKKAGEAGEAARRVPGASGAPASPPASIPTGPTPAPSPTTAREIERIRTQLDEEYRRDKQLRSAEDRIGRGVSGGYFDAAEGERLRGLAATKYGSGNDNDPARRGLSTYDKQFIKYQGFDVASSLGSGAGLATVAFQQGPQVLQQLADRDGGLGAGLKQLGQSALSLVTPFTVGTAAVTGMGAALAYAAIQAGKDQDVLEKATKGVGAATGTTASQLDAIARANAESGKVSASASREIVAGYASLGTMGIPVIESLTRVTTDYARLTGQDAVSAATELGRAISGSTAEFDSIAAKIGGLDDRTRQLIQIQIEQGDQSGAQATRAEYLKNTIDANAASTSGWAARWNEAAAAAKPTLRQRAAALKASVARVMRRQPADQPSRETLPTSLTVEGTSHGFTVLNSNLHSGYGGHPSDLSCDRATVGGGPRLEIAMGRHETFDNAATLSTTPIFTVAEAAEQLEVDLPALGRRLDAAYGVWMQAVEANQEPTARFEAFMEAAKARGGPSLTDIDTAWALPGVLAAEDLENDTFVAVSEIAKAILVKQPRTVAELAVQARAVIPLVWLHGHYAKNASLGDDEDSSEAAVRALINSALTLAGVDWRGQPAVHADADPIFTMIEEGRRLLRISDAIHARRNHTDEEGSAALQALHAHCDTQVLTTVPTTAAGCRELARFGGEYQASNGSPISDDEQAIVRLIAASPLLDASAAPAARTSPDDPFADPNRHEGCVPYPTYKPSAWLAIEVAIPLEAKRLLDVAQAEFDRRVPYYNTFPPSERAGHITRMRAEYRLDDLLALASGRASDGAIDDRTHLTALLNHVQTRRKLEEAAVVAETANEVLSALGDADFQAYQIFMQIRPKTRTQLLDMMRHIADVSDDYDGLFGNPDVYAAIIGAVEGMHFAAFSRPADYDLSRLSVMELALLSEITQRQRETLIAIENQPCCLDHGTGNATALGEIIEAEGNRMAFLTDYAVAEVKRRRPTNKRDVAFRLEAMVRHSLTCNGDISPDLLAEVTATWGAR